tara:strand:+ start:183 stop:398 length:216 start_codon:yes stop_codon:yes gene_type:complete
MMIDKKIIESKLEELNSNKLVVQERITKASETIKQANADLNAIAGAIQLCEQLLSESVEDKGDKPVEIVDE